MFFRFRAFQFFPDGPGLFDAVKVFIVPSGKCGADGFYVFGGFLLPLRFTLQSFTDRVLRRRI